MTDLFWGSAAGDARQWSPGQRAGFRADHLRQLPVMGANNTAHAPSGDQIVVNFPTAGTYPYEVDYTENFFGQLVLTIDFSSTAGHGCRPPVQ